jgi:hypothetical protein
MGKVNMNAVRKQVKAAAEAKIRASLTAEELSQVTFYPGLDLRYDAPPEVRAKIGELLGPEKTRPS